MLSTISHCISFVETKRASDHVVVDHGAEHKFLAYSGHHVKSG